MLAGANHSVYLAGLHQLEKTSKKFDIEVFTSREGMGRKGEIRLIAEVAVLLMACIQITLDIMDVRSVGHRRWWRVLKAFPAKVAYKVSFACILLIVPTRFMCSLSSNFLLFENSLSMMTLLFTGAHFLFYARAAKFIGPFVLMVYTILSRDLSRFILIYSISLIGFSQVMRLSDHNFIFSFYVIFMACAREQAEIDKVPKENVTNILDSPSEAAMRLFIMTIGEFTIFYRSLNACPMGIMKDIGKFLFIVFELFVSIMQFNLLIAMMTRTYETISRTSTEWKRQWAQVILMLEISMKPNERLMAMLKYSRPIGTDKTKRAFVVARKITNESLSKTEKQLREQARRDLREEKRALLKRRLKEIGQADGKRPLTAYLQTSKSPVVENGQFLNK